MTSAAIEINNLSRHFNGLKAVDKLSLQVPSGGIYGFLGPNGAGKTTTIRMLLGLLEPSSGTGLVLGSDIRSQADKIRQRTGVLLEHDGLYTRLSVADNLDFFARIYRLSSLERESRIKMLLQRIDLWERRRDRVEHLSKGMKQKLALARALLHKPALLFLDEPTAGLDATSALALWSDLTALTNEKGLTVFLTTHNLAEAEKVCDVVGVIHRGRLLAEGNPGEIGKKARQPQLNVTGRGFDAEVIRILEQQPEIQRVTQSDCGIRIFLREHSDTAHLVRLLVEHGVEIDEVQRPRSSLEEVFLALVEEKEP